MLIKNDNPAPFPEANSIIKEVLENAQSILGGSFIGMYLEGSLANGDFDRDSDIDFVIVTAEDVSENSFTALQEMHARINLTDTLWAVNLEGSYISQNALRRHDPQHANHPNLERGYGERLKLVDHAETWIIHRFILRERGITLSGPDPKTLIDPILPSELQQAMLLILNGWAADFLNHPDQIVYQGYQSYIVLSLCRILYTLQFGDIVSKRTAAGWAKAAIGGKWNALIDQAWISRHNPQLPASRAAINLTLDLIRYALECGQRFKTASAL